jgi:hypothetical protein
MAMMSTNDNEPSTSERFKQFKSDVESKETYPEYFSRIFSQNSARALETLGGFPGNLQKAGKNALDYLAEITPGGKEAHEYLQEKVGNLNRGLFGEPEPGSLLERVNQPPTSSELREEVTPKISKQLFEDERYLDPKTEFEKKVGDFTQDVTSFFMPGTAGMRLMQRIGIPLAANLSKEGLKYVGLSEDKAEKAKLALMLGLTLANNSNPGEFSSQRISTAKNMIPESFTIDARPLANSLMPLYNRLTRGLEVPSKSRAMEGMEGLANQARNGRINLRSLMDSRDNINEWIAEAGGWNIPGPTRTAAVANLNQLKTAVIEAADQGLAHFPEAQQLYRTGYEAAAVTHQSNAISNFVEKNFGRKASSVGAKVLFPALATGAAILPKTAAVSAALFPLYKAGQVLYRIGRSPTLARYYGDVLTYSLQQNAPAMAKSMDKLDKELAKDEKKQRKGKKMSKEDFTLRFSNN